MVMPAAPSNGTTPSPESTEGNPEIIHALRKDRLRSALFDEPVAEHRFGRYRVVDTLGRGGMGTVLEAADDRLERRVALKLLHREVPARDQGRLLREARALARLSHPNVVQVHEVGERPRPFIAMELVRGQTLDRWQRSRPPWRACVKAYVQAGRGLAAVHEQRLVHRDFKPSNCIIDNQGRVKVMDFGLVRTLASSLTSDVEKQESEEPVTESSATEPSLTQTGAVLGTLAYMSLEQLEGREVDARSDQFGFCVSLHEALYGRRPFEGRTIAALCESMRLSRMWSPPRRGPVPMALRRVLVRGLAVDPGERWPSMNALLHALERIVRPRWRGRLAMAALVGGLSLAGGSVWHEMTVRQACATPRQQLVEVWDAAAKERVSTALLGSELPFADDAWAAVEPDLNAYAERWLESWVDVCQSSRIREDQPTSIIDKRTGCLHQRRIALRRTVEVLATGEPTVIERAVPLVARLPSVERCDDVVALLAELPPPDDPGIRGRVLELRDRLAEVRVLRIAGQYTQSDERLLEISKEADVLDHAPLRAEVELARGWTRYGQGHYEDATAALTDAYAHGVSEGHDTVATAAAGLLSFLEGKIASKRDLGLQWALAAQAHAQRPAAPREALATALANMGAVYLAHGELDLAASKYRDALALQEAQLGPNDVRLAFTLGGLGSVMVSQGHFDEALEIHQRALRLRRENLGPSHPTVAMSLNNIGIVFSRQGKLRDATDQFRRALELKEKRLGPDHPDLFNSLANMGALLLLIGELDNARLHLDRALAIAERLDDPRGVETGSVLLSLGQAQYQQEEFDHAQRTLDRALERLEQAYGPSHPKLIGALIALAEAALTRGDLEAAAGRAQRSLEIIEEKLPPQSPIAAHAWRLKARIAREEGDLSTALEHAERAQGLQLTAGSGPSEVIPTRMEIARIFAAAGQRERALELVQELRTTIETTPQGVQQSVRRMVDELFEELEGPRPREGKRHPEDG